MKDIITMSANRRIEMMRETLTRLSMRRSNEITLAEPSYERVTESVVMIEELFERMLDEIESINSKLSQEEDIDYLKYPYDKRRGFSVQ
jgi:hypothetical protein